MARRTKGSKTGKAKARKTTRAKRSSALKAARRRIPPAADQKTKVMRLTRELSEALERQTATSEVLQIISRSAFDLDYVLRTLVETAAKLCRAGPSQIYQREGEVYRSAAIRGEFTEAYRAIEERGVVSPGRGTLIGRVALVAQPVQIADAWDDPEYEAKEDARTGNVRSMLGVPLLRDGGMIGAFALARDHVEPFSPREIDLLQTFADQAVIALQNARLFNEVQAKTRDLTEALTYQTGSSNILRVIASSPTDVGPVLKAIVESACELCEAYDAVVLLKDGGDLRFSAHHGPILLDLEQWPVSRRWTSGRAFLDQRPVHVLDMHSSEGDEFPEGQAMARRQGHRTSLSVPMLREGVSIGVIVVRRAEVHPFSEKQIALLQTYANQAVIAIGNVRLFDEVQSRTRELSESLDQQTATSEVLSVISSSAGDLVPVFDAMLGKAMDLCGADFGVLNTFDGERFHTAATRGLPPAYDEYRRSQPLDYGPGTAPARLLRGEPIVEITDLLESDAYRAGERNRHALVDLGGARCLLAVPLLKDERVVGNVMIFRQEKRLFSDKQIALLKQFAAQAVIAIENTRLLRELRASTDDLSESLQQQTATADVLKVISRSAFDLETVLITLTESAKALCDSASGIIYRREGEVYRYAASTMDVDSVYREYERRTEIKAGRGTLIGRVALEKRTVQITDAWTDPEYTEQEPARLGGGVRAMLGVPLMQRGEPIGAFALGRKEPVPFTQRQVELVTTFADQAVIAIENARLFEEVQTRTRELSHSLEELRAAQDRLVQTEKLASLGQLTAGIAHEIKNPLNFVNNFSALSAELVGELDETLAPVALDQKTRMDVGELTKMLKSNLEKVVQHGKRADSIVKNMLLHSREGSGEHRSADVNALVEESLNLAYHGARAERSDFNITLERDLDPEAGAAELYPQEITRALLNLISNGFYAAVRRKSEAGGDSFEPTLGATTRSLGNNIEIRIRDNGAGIPPEVKEKMFNPFFTTKPAGEGTGLGLSMSYDIVVKQHGGRIDVDTEPGVFTEFIITLPRTGTVKAITGGKN